MKKVLIPVFVLVAFCFLSNDALAQSNAKKKVPAIQANKYVISSNTAVKIHKPVKQTTKDALLARRAEVSASTTLTPAEKQAIIDEIDIRLAALEN